MKWVLAVLPILLLLSAPAPWAEVVKSDVAASKLLKAIGDIQPLSAVSSVAFSPDGARLATGSYDGKARVWDRARGVEIVRLEGHGDWVSSVAFSPDGARLATGSDDGTARIWDLASGAEIAQLNGHESIINSVAFSPDGAHLATGSWDETARIWDLASGAEIARLEGYGGWVYSVAFSSDGALLATGSYDANARIWDLASGAEIARLEGHRSGVASVAFSPDGGRLATGSSDETARIWDLASGVEIARLEGHGSGVASVAFSPDGARLATGSSDDTARIWDLVSGAEITRLEGHKDSVHSVAFSPDGAGLATGSSDATARIWDPASGAEIARLEGQGPRVSSVAFSPDGARLATGSADGTAQIWDLASGAEIARLTAHGDMVYSVAFSPDGARLATGAGDGTARIWDLAGGAEIARLNGNGSTVLSVAFSPNGARLTTGSSDGSVRIWYVASGAEIARLERLLDRIVSVVFSPDSTRLAAGSDDGTAWIWDVASGAEIARLEGHGSPVFSVVFSPDSTRLAAGSDDGTARIWDVASGAEVAHLEGHRAPVYSVVFSPDGTRLATGSGDGTARIWDVASGVEIVHLDGHADRINSVAFSPDGTRLATGSLDGTARVWKDEGTADFSLTAGRGGRWLSCDYDTHSCQRWDDGRLALEKSGAILRPIIPPQPTDEAALRVGAENDFLRRLFLQDGVPANLSVSVANKGGPAFGAQVRERERPDISPEGATIAVGVLDPVVVLPSGETTDVGLRLIARSSELNPRSGRVRLPLKLAHTYGDVDLATLIGNGAEERSELYATVLAPELSLTAATLEAPANDADETAPYTLTARVNNTGGMASGLLKALLTLTPEGDASTGPFQSDEVNLQQAIPADGGRDLIFAFARDAFGERPPEALTASLKMQTTNHLEASNVAFHRYSLSAPVVVISSGASVGDYLVAAAIAASLLAAAWLMGAPQIPAVARVTADSNALFQQPVERLPRLRSLLYAARRSADVLEAAGVPKRRFDAVSRYPKASVDEKLRILSERLMLKTAPLASPNGLTILDADTPDQLMLNLPRLRLVGVDPHVSAEGALSVYATSNIGRDLLAVFVSGNPEQRRELEKAVAASGEFAAVASGEDLTRILLSDEPLDAFAKSIARQVRATRISAYQSGGGVSQAAAFFGREAELRDVLNRNPANYFLIGARQVGKSSFLKEVERRAAALDVVEARYCTLADADLGGPLCDALGLAERTLEAALEHLGAPDAPTRMMMVDEADLFIQLETTRDYETLRALRRLTEEGRAYFIFAGFWHLYRSIAMEFQSPLKNFGQLIVLEGLEPEAARDLITKPMSALGLIYESPDLVEEIRLRTGSRANLMAIACDEILKSAPPELRVITKSHVADALASTPLRSALLGWSEMSGVSAPQANELDQIVVYSTAGAEGFTAGDLERRLRDKGLSVSGAALREALVRLEIGYVLSRSADTRYRFRVPLFVELIQDYDQDVELEDLIRRHRSGR